MAGFDCYCYLNSYLGCPESFRQNGAWILFFPSFFLWFFSNCIVESFVISFGILGLFCSLKYDWAGRCLVVVLYGRLMNLNYTVVTQFLVLFGILIYDWIL